MFELYFIYNTLQKNGVNRTIAFFFNTLENIIGTVIQKNGLL